jgi:hypothetical protein
MKKRRIFALIAAVFLFSSCGGGGGGGGLPASRVEMLYQLTFSGTPLMDVMQPLLQYLAENCPAASLNVNIADTACEKGGTWKYSGTVSCILEQAANTITLTISNMTSTSFNLNACASQVNDVDTNGDGTPDPTNVELTGNISPFAFSNTTVVAVFPGDPGTTDPTSVTVNGSATAAYTNMQLGGDFTAALTFTEHFTFTGFEVIQEANPPACASNIVNATENSQSGTCTIQSNCFDCL